MQSRSLVTTSPTSSVLVQDMVNSISTRALTEHFVPALQSKGQTCYILFILLLLVEDCFEVRLLVL